MRDPRRILHSRMGHILHPTHRHHHLPAAQWPPPPQDWRIGSTFYLCAIMQTLGIVVAWRYFKAQRDSRLAVSTTK